uniref:Putative secreted protein n=1 Tax=Anopheles darlingi TaxID=43151 RepID=A0A2M4D2F7_ANODA
MMLFTSTLPVVTASGGIACSLSYQPFRLWSISDLADNSSECGSAAGATVSVADGVVIGVVGAATTEAIVKPGCGRCGYFGSTHDRTTRRRAK